MTACFVLFLVVGCVLAAVAPRLHLALSTRSATRIVALTGAVIGGALSMVLVPGHLLHLHPAGLVGAVIGACFLLIGARAADADLHVPED